MTGKKATYNRQDIADMLNRCYGYGCKVYKQILEMIPENERVPLFKRELPAKFVERFFFDSK